MKNSNGIPFGVGGIRVFSGRETAEDLVDIVENTYPGMEAELARVGLDPVCEVRLAGPVVDGLLVEEGDGYRETRELGRLKEHLADRQLISTGISGGSTKWGTSREDLIARNGVSWAEDRKFETMRKGLHLLPHLHNGTVSHIFVQSLAGIMRSDIEGREAELNPLIARNVARVAAELFRLSEASGERLMVGLDPTRGQSLMYAEEVVVFWDEYLSVEGRDLIVEELGVSEAEAKKILKEVVQIRLDAGHSRMNFADPTEQARIYADHGIGVCGINLGNSTRLEQPSEHPKLADFISHYADGSPILVQVQGRKGDWRGFITEHLTDLRDRPELIDGLDEMRIHAHLRLDQEQDAKFGFPHLQAEAMDDFRGLCAFYRSRGIPMPPVYSHVIDYRDEKGERIPNSERDQLYEAVVNQALYAGEQIRGWTTDNGRQTAAVM